MAKKDKKARNKNVISMINMPKVIAIIKANECVCNNHLLPSDRISADKAFNFIYGDKLYKCPKCSSTLINESDLDVNLFANYKLDLKNKILVLKEPKFNNNQKNNEMTSKNKDDEQKKDEVAIENEQLRKIIKATPHDKKFKHAVYTQIIKKYGQKAGLELYNSIKPQLKQM